MNEKTIEKRLTERIRRLGGTAYKFSSPAHRHVPDRLVLLPGGAVVFVEVKAPGKRPTRAQAREFAEIERTTGRAVLVIDSQKGIDDAFPG